MRGRQTLLDGAPDGVFLDLFTGENGLDRASFVVDEAMFFGATQSWWGRRGPRVRPHEGLDICRFYDAHGERMTLAPGVKIPVTFDGEIQAMMADDFMGRSICVYHTISGVSFFSVYAHVEPVPTFGVGDYVGQGEIIATLSDPKRFGLGICPHLHLSLMQVDPKSSAAHPQNWRWETLWETQGLGLFNPETLLGDPLMVSEDAADAMLWKPME